MSDNKRYTNEQALKFHKEPVPGKLKVSATKPLLTQSDLALAYSPGVAAPCLEIADNKDAVYDYTSKGNMVAVISNGTAILGLGALGALASKPVMEGKSVLFKRFADIDSIDLEIDATDPDELVNSIKNLGPSFGGINLEDIKAPECFYVEQKLKELMDIPVFHDDQHGTAIITVAGLINAAYLTGRNIEDMKLVVLGAGSAGIACIELAKSVGVKQAILVDRQGVIYKGRKESMNPQKQANAIETEDRTLEDAMKGADAFYGLAGPGAISKEMVASMAKNPIIFAMANPEPEMRPEEIEKIRSDAIIATGRSDYPNQINNVLGFPYIFRGALDVRASTINDEMKLAAARALAELARKPVHDDVAKAYGGKSLTFGKNYIIPVPFDPRLISTIPPAVAKAAQDTGVARKPIEDMETYKEILAEKLNPTANTLGLIYKDLKASPKRLILAEGEEEVAIRAAISWRDNGYGNSILVGREKEIREKFKEIGIENTKGIEVQNAALNPSNDKYIDYAYSKLQRKGYLHRDCIRMVKNDRNVFASSMLALGEGDVMVTGLTRSYSESLSGVMGLIPPKDGERIFGLTLVIAKTGKTLFIADTATHLYLDVENMLSVTKQTAEIARRMGHIPRVAFLSYSNFGNPKHRRANVIKEVIKKLDKAKVDFEYDGEMTSEIALNKELRQRLYPFSKLNGDANILIMPNLESSHITTKLIAEAGGGSLIGPVLVGGKMPAQIVSMGADVSDILNIATLGVAGY